MSRCLTCKSSKPTQFSKNEREIPMWMKKQGNYSYLPKILQDDDRYNVFQNSHVLKKEVPSITGIKVKVPLNLGKAKKNTWVFYWAANPLDYLEKPKKNQDVLDSYEGFRNRGLLKTDSEGKITLELECPKPYRVDGISYPAHVHFTTLKKDKTWELDIYSSDITCQLTHHQMRDISLSKNHLIINSLDPEYYADAHIPNSFNLSLKEIKYLSREKRSHKIDNFVRYNIKKYPNIYKLVSNKKIKLKEVPIVVYCYSKTCSSSHSMIELLLKEGYTNIIDYPGGIKEWKEHYEADSNPHSKSISSDTNTKSRSSAGLKKTKTKTKTKTKKRINRRFSKISDKVQ